MAAVRNEQAHSKAQLGPTQTRLTRAFARARTLGGAAFDAIPLCFAILAIALPVLLLPVTEEQESISPGLYPIALIITCASAIRLAILIAQPRPHIVAGTFWMFLYISAGVVPLAQLHTQSFGFFLVAVEDMAEAGLLFLGAAIAFEVGHHLAKRTGTRENGTQQGDDAPAKGRVMTRPRLVGLSIFATVSTAVYVSSLGGPAVFFQSRAAITQAYLDAGLRSDGNQAMATIILAASVGPALVALIGWIIVLLDKGRREATDFLWFALVLGLNVIVNNPLVTARYWALTVLVGIAYAIPGLSRRRFTAAVVLGILGALVIFPYTDVTRYDAVGQGAQVEVTSVAEKISTKDYDQVVMTANGVDYVQDQGFTKGLQTGSALLFFIPRSLWAAKGEDTGVLLGEHFDLAITNLSSPLPLEVWIDFGWIGMGAAFVFFGWGARRMEDRLDLTRDNVGFGKTTFVALLLPLLAGYGFILMRGPLLQSMSKGMALVVACYLVTGPAAGLLDGARKGARRIVRPHLGNPGETGSSTRGMRGPTLARGARDRGDS
ncbi:hypothetical protein [Demequina silvatica]|uniref:hypothetical protein n=1 Tax=Demequina silvatica TaxID=1638988 RepID=UPI000783CC63|nr:hypothetical protein [Demequina silvatica]